MVQDYKQCLTKLRKDTLSITMEEFENSIINDSPDDELYFVSKYLYRRITTSDSDVSDSEITAVCLKYADYEWWAKCVKEIKEESDSYEIYLKQNLAERIIHIFDYYHSEILSKEIIKRLTSGDPPPNNLTNPTNQTKNAHHTSSMKPNLALPDELNSRYVLNCFRKAVLKGYIKPLNDNKLEWLGENGNKSIAQLAYFCGLIFGYKMDIRVNGNAGGRVPYTALEDLFGVKRLDRSLRQVHEATKPQHWRMLYDNLLK